MKSLWCRLGRHKLKMFMGVDLTFGDAVYSCTLEVCMRHCGIPARLVSQDLLKSIKIKMVFT